MSPNINLSLLQDLLKPLQYKTFLDDFHEINFCHISNRHDSFYENIVTTQDIDAVLRLEKILPNAVKLINNGEHIPEKFWTKENKSKINHQKIISLLKEGKSLVINHIHNYLPNLHVFVQKFNAENTMKSWCNLYVTPPTAKAFTRHYDKHDVFILQISGSKNWDIYELLADLPDDNLDTYASQEELENSKLTKSLTLKQGELLYIPRGLVHEASTTHETSVHITLGYVQPKLSDILNQISKDGLKKIFFRKSITTALKEYRNINELEKAFKENIKELLDTFIFEEYINQYLLDFKHKYSDFNQGLSHFINSSKITGNSIIQLRENINYHFYTKGVRLAISINDNTYEYPILVKPLIDEIFKGNPLLVSEIASNLPNDYKVKIIKGLADKGFINIISL